MELKEANEVMGKFNKTFDAIREKKEEFDKKRMHSRDAALIYEGLRFAHIEMCELLGEVEEVILQ